MKTFLDQNDLRRLVSRIKESLSFKATKTELNKVEAIAKGRATGYVFNTQEDMYTWISDTNNTSKLNLGDNLYIRNTDVPDYWWDGTSAQQLETQKVDLAEYAKTENVPTKLSGLEDDSQDEPIRKAIFAITCDDAARATCDNHDNNISETYATKDELNVISESCLEEYKYMGHDTDLIYAQSKPHNMSSGSGLGFMAEITEPIMLNVSSEDIIQDYVVKRTEFGNILVPTDDNVLFEECAVPKTYVDGEISKLSDIVNKDIDGNFIHTTYATKTELTEAIGDIETALDGIIVIQNELIGGDSV